MLDGLLSAYWKWFLPAPILSLLETWSHSQYLSKFSEAKVLTLTSDAELSFVLSSDYSSSEHPMCVAFVLFCWPRYGIHLSVDIHKTPFSQNICVLLNLIKGFCCCWGKGTGRRDFHCWNANSSKPYIGFMISDVLGPYPHRKCFTSYFIIQNFQPLSWWCL